MASYLINKKHQDESVVSIKELEGYQFKPRATKDSYIKVDRVTIVDRVMIDKILTMKFNKSFKKVVALAMQVINDEDADDMTYHDIWFAKVILQNSKLFY